MRKFNSWLDWVFLAYRYVTAVIVFKPQNGLRMFTFYLKDMLKYKRMTGSEDIKLIDTYPIVDENTKKTAFDAHYFYQSAWAMKKVVDSKVLEHVDVGSQINLIGDLTAVTKVIFIDLRPLQAKLENLECRKGSILKLPFAEGSVQSLSCLHVAEHIGLGRYGDKLDPNGTKKAAKELARVLAKGGNLYFSLPIGKPRLCFNAHRIHSPDQILEFFKGLELVELSGVDDFGLLHKNFDVEKMSSWDYGCGLFHFRKV